MVLAGSIVTTLIVSPAFAADRQADTPSPEGQLLVVTTNLKEAFDNGDIGENSDMAAYVRRLLNQVPYVPDALMVQEVRRSSAAVVARFLTEATGMSYRVAAKPGDPPWTEKGGKIIDRETAIIVNSATVEVLGRAGRFTTSYETADANPQEPVRVRHHRTLSIREIAGGSSLSLASVHYVQNHFLESYSVGETYKAQWVQKTARVLDQASGERGTQATVIGGDFNASRGKRDSQTNHSHSAWLLGITGDPFNFLDAVWEVTREGGPDYLLTRAGVIDAGVDIYYDTQEAQRAGYFYSDHRFRWALIAPGEKGEPYQSEDGSF